MVDYPAMACGGPTMESKWNGESFFSMKTGFFNLIFNPRIKCVMLTPDEKMFHGLLGGYFPSTFQIAIIGYFTGIPLTRTLNGTMYPMSTRPRSSPL